MITNHTQLIQALIDKYNLESYCEIGLQNANNNFNKIKCAVKCSVDPDPKAKAIFDCTSDEFFKVNSNKFSIFFIDGLHHADQVKRDFENSLKCLNYNGFIVIHDVLPENEQGTKVPRETRMWWGDVYKFAMSIRNHYSDIRFVTFNVDNGCMLVWKEPNTSYTSWNEAPFDWNTYLKFGKILMNVVNEVTI
jgi:hypothetical protein